MMLILWGRARPLLLLLLLLLQCLLLDTRCRHQILMGANETGLLLISGSDDRIQAAIHFLFWQSLLLLGSMADFPDQFCSPVDDNYRHSSMAKKTGSLRNADRSTSPLYMAESVQAMQQHGPSSGSRIGSGDKLVQEGERS
ncbi:hypothetical protein IWX91DRAFT_370978 [Phyllosticta citricarpa]